MCRQGTLQCLAFTSEPEMSMDENGLFGIGIYIFFVVIDDDLIRLAGLFLALRCFSKPLIYLFFSLINTFLHV